MKQVAVLIWSIFMLVNIPLTQAQNAACSLRTVLASFEAAALSDAVENWQQRYEASDCPVEVLRAVHLFARGYDTFLNQMSEQDIPFTWQGTGQGVSNYRGQLSANLGFYDDVGVSFTQITAGTLTGTMRLDTATANIPGAYYFSVLELPQPELWNVIVGCQPEDIVVWLEWVTSEPTQGNILRGLLYVAVITDDGQMCAAAYDTATGGEKVTDWLLYPENE